MSQSIESTLRAMARNYANGHSWDHLDGESVTRAADELTQQRTVIEQLKSLIASLRAELVESYSIDASAERSAPKCDGNHGGGQCQDPECWNGGELSASAALLLGIRGKAFD